MFLIEKFQQFYGEVINLRERVGEGIVLFDDDISAEPRAGAGISPNAVWRRLLSALERQDMEASRLGGDLAQQVYRRAQFAMAALADEVFLHLDWIGRESWRQKLLESKLFGTHHAGEELFERIETLLRDPDGGESELARVYLMVLALGFQGKYRGRDDAAQQIEVLRRRLFRFIHGHDPRAMRGQELLVPKAYSASLDRRPIELPHLKPWVWAIILITVLWLGIGHLIWRNAAGRIEPLIAEILGEGAPAVNATPVAGGGQ